MAAYLARARREPPVLDALSDPRPEGDLVWIHASDPDLARRAIGLGQRLIQSREALFLLLTGCRPGTDAPQADLITAKLPSENPADVSRFLDNWRPDLCLWIGQSMRPALLDAARSRSIPLTLVETRDGDWETGRWRLVSDPVRQSILFFDQVFAHSARSADSLSRTGLPRTRIVPGGPFLEDLPPLPCPDADLNALSTALSGRPLWLAAEVPEEEVQTVLGAHRTALRLAHRLLLVVAAKDDAAREATRVACAQDGWRMVSRKTDVLPDERVQVLLAGPDESLGLWYRLSPVTYLGGALKSDGPGANPLEAAALGTALLHGPHLGTHPENYARLARAGAVRVVRDAETLASTLIELNAPNRAAAMAHAGWEVVTEGAELTNRIVDYVAMALDGEADP